MKQFIRNNSLPVGIYFTYNYKVPVLIGIYVMLTVNHMS